MDALVGGEVQGKISAVTGLLALRAKPHNAGGEDLADLGEPLGGGHQIRGKRVRELVPESSGHDCGVSA